MTNAITWLEGNYFHRDFDANKIQDLLHYSLMWNVFEEKIYRRTRKPQDIALNTNLTEFANRLQSAKDFFIYRYSDPEKLCGLNLCNSGFNCNAFKEKLHSSDNKLILESLIMICIRLRNNLFHGTKRPEVFIEQNTLFKHANDILIYLLTNKK